MQTTVETLEDHKVRLTVAVSDAEFDKAVDKAFKKIAFEVRLPGFRPGKAPRKLLEARIGTDAARQQALQDGLPEFYAKAVVDNDVDVIGFPEIEITGGQDDGQVEFTAVVEVRPVVVLVGYDSLLVTVEVESGSDEAIDRQIDSMRARGGELTESTRPLADGDYATIDISGSATNDEGESEELDGLVAKEFLYKVGSGNVVPELDEELSGTKVGATLKFSATLGDRFGDRSGTEVQFDVEVKGCQEQVLPDLTDEWASENSEFETVEEIRADLRSRLDLMGKLKAQMSLRDKVIEAAAALVPVVAPESLVAQESRRRLQDLEQRLGQQGLGIEQYLGMAGTEPQAFLDQLRDSATAAVLADLAIRAVVSQEAIETSEAELDAEIIRLAEEAGQKPDKARRNLEKNGYIDSIRSDIARGKALQFLVDHAKVVDQNGEAVDLALPEPATAATVPETESDTQSDQE